MHDNPKKIFNIPDQLRTYVEVDLDEEWEVPQRLQYTKAGWTPFAGRKLRGVVRRVLLRGEEVYVDGQVLVKPGFGEDIRKVLPKAVTATYPVSPLKRPVSGMD